MVRLPVDASRGSSMNHIIIAKLLVKGMCSEHVFGINQNFYVSAEVPGHFRMNTRKSQHSSEAS